MSEPSARERAEQEIQNIFVRYKSTITQQLKTIEDATAAILERTLGEELRSRAQRDAHKLAGSAGTFGFPRASEVAREIEHALDEMRIGEASRTPRLAELAVALRDELEGEPHLPQHAPPTTAVERPVLLTIDPDENFCERLIVEAVRRGMHVRCVATAEEARVVVAEMRPDAVLLDLGSGGAALHARRLLEDLGGDDPIPTLVLTTEERFTDRVETARLGARGFLQKPIPPEHALDAVGQLLDRLHPGDMRVLALDDNPTVLEAIEMILGQEGITVTTLSEPSAFWDTLEQTSPDLVMLDLDMPDVTGVDLCRVVRNDPRWSQLPVLFLTAHNDPSIVSRIFEAGADDYLAKPIIGPELVMRISNRLERLRLYRTLAESDPLTGTANRRKALDVMSRLMPLADRYRQPLSVAVLDLDKFKQINDQYGHVVGDQVLRELGNGLLRTFRGEDVVARWGGEEFLVGMYGMRRADGVQRVAEVLEWFRETSFMGSEGSRFKGVSFSAGIAEYKRDGEDLNDLFRAADSALYEAKTAGRDRVVPAGWTAAPRTDVVLVEDDEALVPVLLQALETRGMGVMWIKDGSEAAEVLAGSDPSVHARVVVLDWDLPGLDGASILRRLARARVLETTRVIMLTARSNEAEVLSVLDMGAVDHVSKPFSVPVLMQRIRRAMDR